MPDIYSLQSRKCDFGYTYNGQSYDFTDQVDSVTVESPEKKHLTRGANGRNTRGLIYTEGRKDPMRVTVVFVGLHKAHANLFKEMYDEDERVEAYCIDRKTGQKRIFKECIISEKPIQTTMSEGAEELNVQVIFETYNVKED